MDTCLVGRRGRIWKPLPCKVSLFAGPVTETAPLVLAQEIDGGRVVGLGPGLHGQYSTRATSVSTPSFPQGRVILLQLLHQSRGPRGCVAWHLESIYMTPGVNRLGVRPSWRVPQATARVCDSLSEPHVPSLWDKNSTGSPGGFHEA